jgi:Tfp pilus assembly protein PilF
MYLPLAAVVTAMVLGADRGLAWVADRTGWRPERLKVGAAVVVGIILTALTVVRNEDYREPVRMYRKMLVTVPANDRVWNNLGAELVSQGRFDDAAEAFREAIRHPSELTPYVHQLAWRNLIIALERGRRAELVPALIEFVAAEPENPSRRFLLAHARFEARDLAGAVAEYRTAIETASRNGFPLREPMVFGYYGQALLDSGEPEAAIKMYHRALELQSNLPVVHNQLGQVLTRLGRYDEAERHLRAAADQQPEMPYGFHNLAVMRMHQGKPAEAIPLFKEALRRDPKHLLAALGLAHALHESGRTAEAKRAFAAVGQLSRDWPQRMVDLSWTMSTDWDPRARYAAEGLRLARLLVAGVGDHDAGVLNILAAALAANEQFEEAERTARRAVEIARTGGHGALASEVEERRALYARRQPYRQPTPAPR